MSRRVDSSLSIQGVGKLKALTRICLILLFLLSLCSTAVLLADVPTVLEIEATMEGGDTVLDLEIRHSSPSSTHYVDMIEVEINERLDRLTDIEPQTSTTFTYGHNIGTVGYETIRARAHCTVHGWSAWVHMDAQPEPPFIETPIGMATVAGAVVAVVVAVFLVLKKIGKV